jgi:hypothetical protein
VDGIDNVPLAHHLGVERVSHWIVAGSVIAATAALGGASVALADGYSAPWVAYERPADWSGVYFGVSSGYQWSNIPVQFTDFGTIITGTHDDALVGAHLGLQHQFGVRAEK